MGKKLTTSYLTIKEVQLYMLNIFDDVLTFLDENDIPYVLTGGSALGAIRHRGFIPWDDDIDLAIPRDAYNRFLSEYKPKNKNYELISLDTSENPDISYLRVVDVRTASSNKLLNVNNGIFVDIFPLDHVSDSEFLQKMDYYKMKTLDVLRNSTRRIGYRKSESGMKRLIKQTMVKIFARKPISYYAGKMNKLAIKLNERHKNSSTMSLSVVQGINKLRENMEADIYTTNRRKAIFEGREVYVPSEDYLLNMFGASYMMIPESHKSHGKFYLINEKDNAEGVTE